MRCWLLQLVLQVGMMLVRPGPNQGPVFVNPMLATSISRSRRRGPMAARVNRVVHDVHSLNRTASDCCLILPNSGRTIIRCLTLTVQCKSSVTRETGICFYPLSSSNTSISLSGLSPSHSLSSCCPLTASTFLASSLEPESSVDLPLFHFPRTTRHSASLVLTSDTSSGEGHAWEG